MPEKQTYFIFGKDAFYVSYQVERLLDKLIPNASEREFSLEKFSRETPLDELLIAADSLTLGASQRVVWIDQPDFLSGKVSKEKEKKLLAYVENPNPMTVLIVSWVVAKKPTKFQEKFAKATQSIELPELKGKHFEKLIQELLKPFGKKIDQEALVYLIQRQQVADNKLLVDEVEKACLFVGERAQITVEDLEKVSTPTVHQSVFTLLDAVMDGALQKAFSAWKDLKYLGEEPLKVLFLLTGNFKRILMVQALLQQRYGKKAIEEELQEHPFVIEKSMRFARRIKTSSLTQGLDYLLEMDVSLKTVAGADPEAALEDALIYLCALVKA